MSDIKLPAGAHPLADHVEDADAVAGFLRPLADAAHFLPLVLYPVKKLWEAHKRGRMLRELLPEREEVLSVFMKPAFRRNYAIEYGTEKAGLVGPYDRTGAITNFGASVHDAVLRTAESFVAGPLPHLLKAPDIREFCTGIYDRSALVQSIVDNHQSARAEYLETLKRNLSLHAAESSEALAGRRPIGTIAMGGWIPNLRMRDLLLGNECKITYMLRKPADVDRAGGIRHIEARTPLTREDIEHIAASGQSLDWGIAYTRGDGTWRKWLVEPEPYEHTVRLARPSFVMEEPRPPFQRSGAIWLYEHDPEKPLMAIGGDKAPGSAVTAPLNDAFLQKLTADKDNVRKVRLAVGDEPSSVAVALEYVFHNRIYPHGQNSIPWSQRYNFPLWAGPGWNPQQGPSDPVGVHDISHVKSIEVKEAVALKSGGRANRSSM